MSRITDPRLGLVAGEASGDLLASLLLQALQARWPGLTSAGIGGPKMQALGFDAWWPSHKLSIFGYWDALKNIRELLAIRRQLGDRLIQERPSVFVGVDAPDFNFGLEQRLREAGIKTVHFVCPSIWAWRAERVHTIKRSADHVLCLFPFEPELLQRHGIGATYVGHPLADKIPMEPPRTEARNLLGLPQDATVVAVLPGSRRSELNYIFPPLLDAARRMLAQRPGLRFVVPVAPGVRELAEALVREHGQGLDLMLLDGQAHDALAACDLTLVASGTATLEAALFKRPMVIAYKLHWFNAWRMKGKALLPWVGLPNVLARETVVPECLQEQCTGEVIAREGLAWLDDAPRRERLHQRFTEIHETLRCNTAQRAGDAIAQILGA
ncbi:lipid-A-disaccharide synthase [Roseateles terrae]|uniref:Lipid-A-disaccharide synthase n=1 Tax=Roseateles terrae TaxID=431060 RepID=A0ABR6GWB5_9BURK|nr:lipid-A-disaccharide synthase [Roseateles terrae]MBB3196345.1 lipid-A-disaccharide synthase [Roseateles terrae]OWQ83910.1 lipid-A-disaccharide synthase [Roseateles terrae]